MGPKQARDSAVCSKLPGCPNAACLRTTQSNKALDHNHTFERKFVLNTCIHRFNLEKEIKTEDKTLQLYFAFLKEILGKTRMNENFRKQKQ